MTFKSDSEFRELYENEESTLCKNKQEKPFNRPVRLAWEKN